MEGEAATPLLTRTSRCGGIFTGWTKKLFFIYFSNEDNQVYEWSYWLHCHIYWNSLCLLKGAKESGLPSVSARWNLCKNGFLMTEQHHSSPFPSIIFPSFNWCVEILWHQLNKHKLHSLNFAKFQISPCNTQCHCNLLLIILHALNMKKYPDLVFVDSSPK